MHRGSIHQRHPKAPFKSKPCGFDCYTVLAPVSKCYPLLMGRLPTCYSPVRHSSFSGGASSGGKRSVRLACIRHAASVRPEPGSNSHKVRTILRLLSSICLLAYCLLVKNVCCLELNQDALHIWFVLLCSVFKGLIFLFQQLFNLIRFRRECQQLLCLFFLNVFIAH